MAEGRMWSTVDSARWFFVPAGVGLPAGALEIRDLLGRRQQVEAEFLAPFEVRGDAAKTLVRRQILDLLAKADAGLESLRSLVPEDRPEGAQGLDVMRTTLAGILAGLKTRDDPPPPKYRPDDLAQRFEGWLRGVAADPKGAEDLQRFATDLQQLSRQLAPTAPVAVVTPAREARKAPKAKGPPKKASKAKPSAAAPAPADPEE